MSVTSSRPLSLVKVVFGLQQPQLVTAQLGRNAPWQLCAHVLEELEKQSAGASYCTVRLQIHIAVAASPTLQ